MTPDYDSLIEAALVLGAALGVNISEIILNDSRGRPKVVLPVKPPQTAPADSLDAPLAILRILREKQPLTGLSLFDELQRAGVRIGKSTFDRLVAKMVADGDLANPQGAKPPGYRLPE